jgi:CelD/BcsL family acetyltransferase involved in cellulose biosynthesis
MIVLVRRADGSAQVLLPLYFASKRPLRLLRFVGAGPSDELGPLCAPADRPIAAELLRRHARQALGSGGLFLAERLQSTVGIGARLGGVPVKQAASPLIRIANRSFEEYLSTRSPNFRRQVRRYERRIVRQYRLEYRLTTDPDELERDMETLIRLHQARWTNGQSVAFAGALSAFHKEFARRALDQGWLRLWKLQLDGRPAAMWYGLRYAGIDTFYQAGRDPRLARLDVGFVLLCHTVRCAFEDGMDEYRFGLGDETYKNRFTDADAPLETVGIPAGSRGHIGLAALRVGIPVRRRLRALRG